MIEASVDGGADAVMTTFGVAKRYREQLAGRIPTIIRLDGGPSSTARTGSPTQSGAFSIPSRTPSSSGPTGSCLWRS